MRNYFSLGIFVILFTFLFSCEGNTGKIQFLLEKNEVINTVTQLFISTDNQDWIGVKNVFDDDVLFDMKSLNGEEAKVMKSSEIIAGWAKGLKPLKAVHHQVANFLVDIKENKAFVFCYGTATHFLPTKTSHNTRTFVGSYDFDLKKDGNKWKISKFKFSLKFIDGNLNLEKEKQENE